MANIDKELEQAIEWLTQSNGPQIDSKGKGRQERVSRNVVIVRQLIKMNFPPVDALVMAYQQTGKGDKK